MEKEVTLSTADTALARHYGYLLLSRLYLEGLTLELLPFASAVPELAAVLPPSFAADEAAAEHYHLLIHILFPYESIFLDEAGLMGGRVRQALLTVYGRAGYTVEPPSAEPDHIGCELRFLAFVCAAEAEAWARGETAVINQLRGLQQSFLQAHLLRWAIPLAIAIRQQAQPFYVALIDLTLALLNDHYADLLPNHESNGPGFALPERSRLLDDPATRLRDVTRYLLTPPYSGFFLSREVIGQIGRQLNLPVGFGGREDLLATLLHTGGQYELAPECLNALHKIACLWEADYGATVAELSAFAPFVVPWRARAAETIDVLTRLTAHIAFL